MSQVQTINLQAVEAIKVDTQNWLTLYMSATPDQLPPEVALTEAIALEQLAAEIRQGVASKIPFFDLSAIP
jgi:uncharacterized protein YfaT (DUF1175 family)